MLYSLKGQPVTRIKEEIVRSAKERMLIWTFREMKEGEVEEENRLKNPTGTHVYQTR